ncbi:hypothetical protein QBC44DRAFT_47472 [Cladorrhinum sp. PSN332]|nr:hypothetical protein QBC44DRAFT_47472 [Cladorrhinum sp. PSN332]
MNPNYNNTHERGTLRSNNIPPQSLPQTYGSSAASGPAPSTAGHHSHDIMNKLDPRVDSTHDKQAMPTQNQPVHSSRLANTLDPRVDSRTANAQISQPTMHGAAGHGPATGSGPREGTYGPHSSRAANALDPRVDSDLDSRGMRTGNAVGGGYTPGMMGTGAAAGAGAGGAGMHRNAGPNAAISGTHHSTAAGYNNNNMQRGPLPGPAPNTAGPHKSDLLNKLDPRVDCKGGLGHSAGAAGMGAGTYRGDDVRRGI